MLRVLFVCTGNTCRSPMAETLFREMIRAARRDDDILAISAGTAVLADMPASPQAKTVMEEAGLDLSAHRTRPLTPELVRAADLVLTMTARHKQAVKDMVPEAADKTYTIAEYAEAGEPADIADPFGGSLEQYRACSRQLRELLAKIWDKISSAEIRKAGDQSSAENMIQDVKAGENNARRHWQ